MTSGKKLVLLLSVFIALVGASVVLLVVGKPMAKNANPLRDVQPTDLQKIVIENRALPLAVTLEQKNGVWRLTSPLVDETEEGTVKDLTSRLRTFSVGSSISDKKDKHQRFKVNEEDATRVQVTISGKNVPVLNAYVGKMADGFNDSYLRFSGEDSVRVAFGLPGYVLAQTANAYRLKTLFPDAQADVRQVRLQSGKTSYSFSHSSQTWSADGSTRPVEGTLMNQLFLRLNEIRVVEFQDSTATAPSTGFDQPFMSITIETTVQKTTVFGNALPVPKGQEGQQKRYAKTESRDALFLVSAPSVANLVNLLKSFPNK